MKSQIIGVQHVEHRGFNVFPEGVPANEFDPGTERVETHHTQVQPPTAV